VTAFPHLPGGYARHAVRARGGVVSSGNPLVTSAGIDVLRQGGSAMDAAVASVAVQGVVEFPWGGIGGDLFVLVREPDGGVAALNGSGVAPVALHPDDVPDARIPRFGPLSVGVPGFVYALHQAYARYGTWPLSQLLDPAIGYARDGFPLSVELCRAMERVKPQLDASSELWKLFENNGAAAGETFRRPELAKTLEGVAEEGPDAFYEGEPAKSLAAAIRARGGVLRDDDMAAHNSAWVEPISARYRDVNVYTQPPVSLGCVMLIELRMFERLGLPALDPDDPTRVDAMVRCKHAAFADTLAVIGDHPDSLSRVGGLLSDDHIERRCEDLLTSAIPDLARPRIQPGGTDTTCLTVADDQGGIVVLIHSLFNEFGSREFESSTGVILNDRLANQKVGAGPTELSGGRKPIHTLNAFLATRDGAPILAGATPGGRGQVQTNFQVLVNTIECGMDIQTAIDAPRWLSGAPRRPEPNDQLYLEPTLGEDLAEALRRRGHQITTTGPEDAELYGSVVAVGHDLSGALLAAADHRREATAAGF
jgi:gamma-glutamyltranspeptidase/glutathione hydrolase